MREPRNAASRSLPQLCHSSRTPLIPLISLTVLCALPLPSILASESASSSVSASAKFIDGCADYPDRQHRLTVGVLVPTEIRVAIGAAVELALQHIHSRPDLIPDYCVELLYRDTQCKTSVGMKSLFDLMNAERRPVALFGGMCTIVNEPVAMASKYWNIVQLSYAETHAKFSSADSHEVYPTFWRIVPGDLNLNAARCHLIKHYNWTRVGTIKQADEPKYALPHESLTTLLENSYGIQVVYTAGVNSDQLNQIEFQLEELKRRDAHIIVGDLTPDLAVQVLCEAFRLEMFGADYLWLLPGYHEQRWWLSSSHNSSNCSLDQLEAVLQNHMTVEFAPHRLDNSFVVSNRSVSLIRDEMLGSCSRDRCEESVYGAYAYDGMWSLALALNHSLYTDPDGPKGYEESADLTATRLLQYMGKAQFDGVTGRVRFANNERLGLVDIYQWRNGSYERIGNYDGADNRFDVESDHSWTPPRDATVVIRERQYVSYILLGAMCSIAMVGVLIGISFLLINIKYRNHKFIKMSSPNMNNFIIVGSICAYVSVFLLGVDTRFVSPEAFESLCYAKTWVLSVGFTLAFGSMFSKTWRVHSIFTNIRKDKKAIKDTQLFMIVALILVIDFVILGSWAFISPFKFRVTEHEAIRERNKMVIPELEKCQSDYAVAFQVIFYIIKGLLMIFGCFLAWETRAVNVPALNDSKYIGMSVYNVVVMSVIGVSLAFILQEKINEAFLLTSFFIIFCTTLTLCLVFVPKVVELFRTPRGTENQRYRKGMMKSVVGKNPGEKLHRQLSLRLSEGIKEKMAAVEEENLRLHQILMTRSAELWDMLERLRLLGENTERQWRPDSKVRNTFCCLNSSSTTERSTNSHYEVTTTNAHRSSTSSASKTDTLSSLFHRQSGKSVLVKQKTDSGWPWLDPSQPSTML